MACQQLLVIVILLVVSEMFCNISSQQCGIDTYSIYQMMLKGHTIKTFKARPLSLDCREACNSDIRCQSYNYVFFKDICELNNRTKEARPEDFVKNSDRYYMTKAPNRVEATGFLLIANKNIEKLEKLKIGRFALKGRVQYSRNHEAVT
ncbi:hypothetical protein ACROYT_G027497 [Oculina patagonica]